MEPRSLHVLLVEDDEDHATLIQDHLDVLQGRPVRWEWVETVADAEARLDGDGIDAVLLDLRLPDSGLAETVPRVVRAARGVPVIALTSLSDGDVGLEAVRQGAQDYLVKGQMSSELLLRAIRYAVERGRYGRKLERVNRRLRVEIAEREAVERRLREREAELERLNGALERSVEERTGELTRANVSLEGRNRDLQTFAYVASHDLQEPLRKIRTFAELIRDEHGEDVGEDGRHYLGRITDAATRLSTLMRDLLAFSRVDTHGQAFRAVPLGALVEGVVQDLELVVRETGARVEVGGLPTVEGDEVQLRRLFSNLVENALKYRRPGAAPTVRVYERGGEADRRVVVEDDGIGIDEKYLDRIFGPFQRLHGKDRYDGTGMGLAIVRRIAERHGGAVTAESAPGRGARFVVAFPAASAPPGPDGAA